MSSTDVSEDYRGFTIGPESIPPEDVVVLYRNPAGPLNVRIPDELAENPSPSTGGAEHDTQRAGLGDEQPAVTSIQPIQNGEEVPAQGSSSTVHNHKDGDSISRTPGKPVGRVTFPKEPFVVYRHKVSELDRAVQVFEASSLQPIATNDPVIVEDDAMPVFEVIDDFYAIESGIYNAQTMPLVLPTSTRSILIRSSHIMEALRKVVRYPRGLQLTRKTVSIPSPYVVLVHHYNALRAHMRSTTVDTNGPYRHLEMLLSYLDDEIMPTVRAEQERHARGVATHAMLWVAFPPGEPIAIINFDAEGRGGLANRNAAVVRANDAHSDRWTIESYSLDLRGDSVEQITNWTDIPCFDGELELVQLDACPLRLAKDPVGGPLEVYLREQGRVWYNLIKQPWCKHHEGEVLKFPFQQMSGMVMVDTIAHREDESKREPYGALPLPRIPLPHRGPPSDAGGRNAINDSIRPQLVAELSDAQYLLCPQKIAAWHFKSREWVDVAVCNLSEARYDPDMMNVLVMDEERAQLLKALASGFSLDEHGRPRQDHWAADYVQGKGNSQIFLLHGSPGVGKTFTAECISNFTRRPLMTLTANDIGTQASFVEGNLERNFKLAKKWNAIILIDEADIYLERRSQQDLERNGLVAGFLRALEIYEGILFLTTNRVGLFDDAFISRIHVKLSYPPLTDKYRERIWDNFFEKLRREKGDLFEIPAEAENFLERDKIKRLNLNGREIRNIFQTAVDLARFYNVRNAKGKIVIGKKHLEQMVDMSAHFKEYLDKTLKLNESDRAKYDRLRLDEHR